MSEPVDLPWFESGKAYLVSGDALNEIISVINRNRVRVTEGGGISIVEESDDGTVLSLTSETGDEDEGGTGGTGTATYYVVINGVLYTQDFVIDGDPVAV